MVRWLAGEEGGGPEYCGHCMKARGETTPCDDCTRPEILPENDEAIALYADCSGQWRYKPDGAPTGMDRSAVQSSADMMELQDRKQAFAGLRIMENEMLSIMESRRRASSDAPEG